MTQKRITSAHLAIDLCEALNESHRKDEIIVTHQFAEKRQMTCTPTLIKESDSAAVTKVLEVWLDKFHFWLDYHGESDGRKWKLHGLI